MKNRLFNDLLNPDGLDRLLPRDGRNSAAQVFVHILPDFIRVRPARYEYVLDRFKIEG